jgi:hypothetical protein
MSLEYIKFGDICINDTFFDTLKADYSEFIDWFTRKKDEYAYIHRNSFGNLDGFLYYKIENESVFDGVNPLLPAKNRLKIGTFKIEPHGTRLGERFLKKSLDVAFINDIKEVYLTIFPKYSYLISFLKCYGFFEVGVKSTYNGNELILLKMMRGYTQSITADYPFINRNSRKFVLSIYPEWHTRLLPDSILNNESYDAVIKDVSYTNSIHKIYLTAMHGTGQLRCGDILVIYRTTDNMGPANYRSVISSLCVVEEVKNISEFPTFGSFFDYASPYTVFSQNELINLYDSKKYPVIIRFTYNYAFPKRVIREQLLSNVHIVQDYWGFFQLDDKQFLQIMALGNCDERIIFN